MSNHTSGFSKSIIRVMTGLALFMLVLLLLVPILMSDQYNANLIAYVVYAIFLISLSMTIGMGITWMMLSKQGLSAQGGQHMVNDVSITLNAEHDESLDALVQPSHQANSAPSKPSVEHLRSQDEQEIIDFLKDHDGECWQSALTKRLEWTASKTSRTLAKLEYDNIIKRIRDGMGKRIILIQKGE